jgi:hypothetical protein
MKTRPLPVVAPTAFVRIRPPRVRACAVKFGKGRACAGSRRVARL